MSGQATDAVWEFSPVNRITAEMAAIGSPRLGLSATSCGVWRDMAVVIVPMTRRQKKFSNTTQMAFFCPAGTEIRAR
jgi:hypothetical protein